MKYFMTIAGSDNSGGAGVQQDLKVAYRHGFWGLSVITGITVQDFTGLDKIYPLPVQQVIEQIEKNFNSFDIDVVKIGALCSIEIVKAVAELLKKYKARLVILDPVFAPSKGCSFLSTEDIDSYRDLLNYVDLVTPNRNEIELLGKNRPESMIEAIERSKEILSEYGCSVYIKGGHFNMALPTITEVLVTDSDVKYYSKDREKLDYSHGTGCFFASSLACYLAEGNALNLACEKATKEVSEFYTSVNSFLKQQYG